MAEDKDTAPKRKLTYEESLARAKGGSGSNGTVNRLKDFLVWFMHPLQCAKAGVLHE